MTRALAVRRDAQVRGLIIRDWKLSSTYALQREFKGRTVCITLGDTRSYSIKEARAWALKMQSLFAQGIDPRRESRTVGPSIPTLGKAWAARADWLVRNRRPATVDNHNTHHAKFADWMDRPITDITTEMIRDRHSQISQRAPVAANRAIKALRETWNWTHEAMVKLPECPVPKRYLFNPETPKPKALNPQELADWSDAVNAHPSRELHLFTLFSGLRKRTILALRWDWIGWDRIEVPGEYMKSDRDFEVPLTPELRQILAAVPKEDERIFPRAGIRSKSLSAYGHRLRHTFRTYALAAGVPDAFINLLMDHKVSADIGAAYTTPDALFEQKMHYACQVSEMLRKIVDT